MRFRRRDFIKLSVASGATVAFAIAGYMALSSRHVQPSYEDLKGKVFLLKSQNRADAVKRLISKFNLTDFAGKKVALKANYNTANQFPASTHIDTLSTLIVTLKEAGATNITMLERSGGDSTEVAMYISGVQELSRKLGFNLVVVDNLPENKLIRFNPEGSHWTDGFLVPQALCDAEKIVQTCCLKTHSGGGHFTMSLKNSVGLVARFEQVGIYTRDYMTEMHHSPDIRRMIAEINQAYETDLVVMDALKAFVRGGPNQGEIVSPGVMLASRDRVAIDAVGVAILRMYGTTPEVSAGKIFEQEQIARAAELGIGVRSVDEIRVEPLGDESVPFAEQLQEILRLG
jgi:uncharacterized protein (DUF362 family)